jgi:hypothetical protein
VNRSKAIGALGALLVILAACGPAASGSSAPSTAASTAPSVAPPSQAQASQGVAGPSFTAGAVADLEALIPDTVGTLTLTKESMKGSDYLITPSSDPATIQFIHDLGITPSDISMAFGLGFSAESSIVVFVIRAAGADANKLVTAFQTAENSSADSPLQWTNTSVGGKQVQSSDLSGQSTYIYTHGDTLFWVTASDPAAAAQVLSGLP